MKTVGNVFIVLGIVLAIVGFIYVAYQQTYYPPPMQDVSAGTLSEILSAVRAGWRGLILIGVGVLSIIVGAIAGERFS